MIDKRVFKLLKNSAYGSLGPTRSRPLDIERRNEADRLMNAGEDPRDHRFSGLRDAKALALRFLIVEYRAHCVVMRRHQKQVLRSRTLWRNAAYDPEVDARLSENIRELDGEIGALGFILSHTRGRAAFVGAVALAERHNLFAEVS